MAPAALFTGPRDPSHEEQLYVALWPSSRKVVNRYLLQEVLFAHCFYDGTVHCRN